MNRRTFLGLLSAGTVGLPGCMGGGNRQIKAVAMTDSLRFEPASVTVPVGAAVKWSNTGSVEHTVTAYENRIPTGAAFFASGGFDSETAARRNLEAGLLDADDTFRHAFEVRGTYEYFCIPHEGSGMTGSIRVR